jgi:glycosyltransferase involved in cell wall biosynthesis
MSSASATRQAPNLPAIDRINPRPSITRKPPMPVLASSLARGYEPPAASAIDQVDLAVIIPAHNEEHAVRPTIDRIRAALSRLPIRHEIVLIDDASRDGTRGAAESAGVTVIASPVNRGYGWALKRGIAATKSEFVAILDADGTYPPEALPKLLELAQSADMAVGDRSGAMGNVPWVRRPAKWVLNKLANFLARQKIPDLNSGLRVFRRHSLERFVALLPDGFSFTSTITLCMMCSYMQVVYMPIDYGKRIGHSKVRPVDFLNFILLVLRIVVLFQPLRVFMPLGAVLFLLGLAKAAYDLTLWNLSESAVFFLLAALIIWSLGLIADMISRLHLRP